MKQYVKCFTFIKKTESDYVFVYVFSIVYITVTACVGLQLILIGNISNIEVSK